MKREVRKAVDRCRVHWTVHPNDGQHPAGVWLSAAPVCFLSYFSPVLIVLCFLLPHNIPLVCLHLVPSSQICCCWSFGIKQQPCTMYPIMLGFYDFTLLQVAMAGSKAKYQGWPLQRPEVIALRQKRRERRNGDAGAIFFNLFYLLLPLC